MISKVKCIALMGCTRGVESYSIEWVWMKPSCHKQLEHDQREALDVGSHEAEQQLDLREKSTCFRLILGN